MGAAVDLSNRKFGRLTPIKPTDKRCGSHVVWECSCDCGVTVLVSATHLCRGTTLSCGCLNSENRHRQKLAKDLQGKRFGRLTVVKRLPKNGSQTYKGALWLCKCDCGNETVVPYQSLATNYKGYSVKSCGCLRDEMYDKGHVSSPYYGGSNVNIISTPTPYKNNKSGVKGVRFNDKKQRWQAYTKFQGTQYHLGYYKNLEDAVKVRKNAEIFTFEPFLEWYQNLKGG